MAGIVIYLSSQYEYVEDRTMLVRDVTDRGLLQMQEIYAFAI
jgi:hypothetical protein